MQAAYYRASDGSEPVREFIDRLPPKAAAALVNQIQRLNDLTETYPHLPFPHSSQVEGELRELRCHYGSDLYRVLYRRSGNLFILLHIFRKGTPKIPEREKKVAAGRWDDLKRRMGARPRRRPRAIGHDAP